jgi:hypothetical protein
MLITIGDVVDGVLINAIAVAGRRIATAVTRGSGRRGASDLTTARWFETYRLTRKQPDWAELSPALALRLAEILPGDETQAAVHELLAARLTDTHADAARQALPLTLITADRDAAPFAESLADYYDDQIGELVARLEGEDATLLAQIRSEAFSTRMIDILNAIERHTAALTTRPSRRTERTSSTATGVMSSTSAESWNRRISTAAAGCPSRTSTFPRRLPKSFLPNGP